MQFQLPKINHDDSDTFFCLFIFWDFCDTSRRKSLCFFREKLRIRLRHDLEAAKGKNLNFRTYMMHMQFILCTNFGGKWSRDTGFQAKK